MTLTFSLTSIVIDSGAYLLYFSVVECHVSVHVNVTCRQKRYFTSDKPKKYHAWSCQNVCDALTFLLDNNFIRFGTKLYSQEVGIPIGTNCAPLVADLFLIYYERDCMMCLSDDKQADIIDAFNTTSRYLGDILNIKDICY